MRALSLLLLIPMLFALSPAAGAQDLEPARWMESLAADVNGLQETVTGTDEHGPEPIDLDITTAGATVSGAVVPGPPGPPSGSISLHATAVIGDADLTAQARLLIGFGLKVVQTSPPPITVVQVPLTGAAAGSVHAEGDEGIAFESVSSVAVGTLVDVLVGGSADANNDPDDFTPFQNSFDESGQTYFGVDEVLTGLLIAAINLTAQGAEPGSASAYAFVDPVIEIADEIIPGTGASYRDHFTIEFSPGYDYLPVEPVSWGELKTLYEKP